MQLDTVKIHQHSTAFNDDAARTGGCNVYVIGGDRDLARLPFAAVIKKRLAHHATALGEGEWLATDLPSDAGDRLIVAQPPRDASVFELLTLARKLIAECRPWARLTLVHAGGPVTMIEALVAAAAARDFPLPHARSKPKPTPRLKRIDIYARSTLDLTRTMAAARGNNLARYLTALPANALTPTHYRAHLQRLARAFGWTFEFLNIKQLRARKAGAFLAVAQGSPDADAGIAHLRYTPRKASAAKAEALALVGKGICFDTGGANLKSAKSMYGMHEDMEGSAVALGTLLALTELRVDYPVDCWLALAQNHIGPAAYKPNDVVVAANGTSIEIVHTDAEGRMVLADTLTLATAAKPRLVIDYATLTGACVYALGTRYSGATTNREALIEKIIAAGQASGERVWPFPLDADYADELKSEAADIKQCTLGGEADQILAAIFLKRFIQYDTPWVHVDLAAGNHKGGLAHIPTDITGFGVRFTLELLLAQNLLADRTRGGA